MSDFSKPYRVGTYPATPEATEADKTALANALELLAANGWAALPDGCVVRVVLPKETA